MDSGRGDEGGDGGRKVDAKKILEHQTPRRPPARRTKSPGLSPITEDAMREEWDVSMTKSMAMI